MRAVFFPDGDRDVYVEGPRRGGYLVESGITLDILHDDGTIDIKERANIWQSEGSLGRRHIAPLKG